MKKILRDWKLNWNIESKDYWFRTIPVCIGLGLVLGAILGWICRFLFIG